MAAGPNAWDSVPATDACKWMALYGGLCTVVEPYFEYYMYSSYYLLSIVPVVHRHATINAPPPMGPLGGLMGDPRASLYWVLYPKGGTIPKGGF